MKQRHIKSFREYLESLSELGDLVHYKNQVDPHLEIGAITRYVIENRLPMTVMDSIKGHPGFSVTTGVLSASSFAAHPYSRMALALGFDPFINPLEMITQMGQLSQSKPVDPVIIENPAFMQNITQEADVDLYKIPCPFLHEGDGGSYLNSIGTMVVRTPDGRWTNWHICRVMRVDKNHITVWTRKHQHFEMIHQEWIKLNKPMPFALALAPEPAATAISGIRIPADMDEAKVLGGWFGEGIEVAKTVSGRLEVPATAEMVVEGEISLNDMHDEGPFGEYHGYLLLDQGREIVGKVTSIAHTNNPVIGALSAGKPLDDDHVIIGLGGSSTFTLALKNAGLPIRDAWMAPESALHLLVVRVLPTWKEQYATENDFVDAIEAALKTSPMGYVIAHALIIDDDIDPTHSGDVLWAWSSRVHPKTGTRITEPRKITDMPPVFTPAERKIAQAPLAIHIGLLGSNPNAVVTPITPSGFKTLYPEALQKKVSQDLADFMKLRKV